MPTAHLDPRFGSPEADAPAWADVEADVRAAEVWWITTVRADGRPHVTPLLAVWDDDALHFCTGPDEQKAVNLVANAAVALTTGVNTQDDGIDVVVHGTADRVTDETRLRALAAGWREKYGEDWRFDVVGDAFVHAEESLGSGDPGRAHVFAVRPSAVFAFEKGATFSQTRYDAF
jgi:nitroimidazol reductase NimA-like FMN-containing flavoprotein (pyridoxamine 5'-phosphate oxidase superfamily)